MKKLNNRLLLLMVFFSSALFAQENKPFPKVEEMHNRKWQFLVDEAKLTPKDAEIVQPIFMEYEKSIWNFHAKNGEFFKSIRNRQNDPTINYSEINDRYAEIEITQAQMFKNYHLKLKKVLQPEMLFKYYRAEREFKRKLLQNLQDHHHQSKKGPNLPVN
jgi:hypothetical protein